METLWRPKSPRLLTDVQKQVKLIKDSEYEIAVCNIYANKTLTSEEKQARKKVLWDAYYDWAVTNGLYGEVTPEQQLAEAENGLSVQVEQVNLIRTELKKPLVEIRKKVI